MTSQILAFLNGRKVSTSTWRSKYAQLARFFKYWKVLGHIPAIQMPSPRGLIIQTFVPYVYSRSEIRALLQAISRIRQNANAMIHPETFRMLLIILYGTGVCISEAIALLAEDVDLKKRSMCIRLYGRGSHRTLPIGPDLWRILNGYSKWKASMSLRSEWFLVRRDGSCLNKNGIYRLFRMLLREAGVVRRDRPSFRPRIRDFRPTFAVHQINSWIRKGANLNRLLPALSGYLGQANLNSTDHFLLLAPERFKNELDKLSPQKGERWSANAETMTFLSSL